MTALSPAALRKLARAAALVSEVLTELADGGKRPAKPVVVDEVSQRRARKLADQFGLEVPAE